MTENELFFIFMVLTGWLFILSVGVVATFIEVKAMKNSTHRVQMIDPFKDITQEFEPLSDKTKEALKKDFFDNLN